MVLVEPTSEGHRRHDRRERDLFDPIFQGLAISLLFGLASSTAFTVLVIPAIYRTAKT